MDLFHTNQPTNSPIKWWRKQEDFHGERGGGENVGAVRCRAVEEGGGKEGLCGFSWLKKKKKKKLISLFSSRQVILTNASGISGETVPSKGKIRESQAAAVADLLFFFLFFENHFRLKLLVPEFNNRSSKANDSTTNMYNA